MAAETVCRVAVTSRDGVSVNERLHRANQLLVFVWDGSECHFLERRPKPEGVNALQVAEALAEHFSDCQFIFSVQVMGSTKRVLRGKGFAIIECRGPIHDVIRDQMSHWYATRSIQE